jgi:hypothetical protein
MIDDTAAVPSTAPPAAAEEPQPTPEPTSVPDTTKAPASGNTPRGGYYTAIIFFHGMGEQRRYEEMSNLVADLEKHEVSVLAGTAEPRRMFDIQSSIEPARVAAAE